LLFIAPRISFINLYDISVEMLVFEAILFIQVCYVRVCIYVWIACYK
jgi:hypothetical protein